MTDFQVMVIDLLIAMDVMEAVRLLAMAYRWLRKDWRRKKKDE